MAAAVQHSIVFEPGYSDKSYKLFELEEDVLQELLRADGRCAPADRASACAPPPPRRVASTPEARRCVCVQREREGRG